MPTKPRFLSCPMRIDKFTQKMQEAVQASQDVASEFNQQEITNEHFLLALLDQAKASPGHCSRRWAWPRSRLKEQLARGAAKTAAGAVARMSICGSGTISAACSTGGKGDGETEGRIR